ncbi:nucleotide-sugar transporter-domain-containing protein [Cladorrhinum sp. PSN332]|nr:nucleotide-sugar transporter-domain-containing protein [Cladorrhinum sp. PSN332]
MALRTTTPASGPTLLGLPMKQASLITLTFQNSALILVMHYSRRMAPSGDHRYFASTAVLLNEVLKLATSLTFAIYEVSGSLAPQTPATVLLEQVYNSVFSGDGWKLAIPAVLYTFENTLQYVALGNLDPVHFQVLFQLKIITTAVFMVVLLGRTLGIRRWVSLIILTLGVSIVSLPSPDAKEAILNIHDFSDHFFPRSVHELGTFAGGVAEAARELTKRSVTGLVTGLTRRSATYEGIKEDQDPRELIMSYSVGVTAVVVAALVSGLTGVYFEKVLKDSASPASVWTRNVQLSFYSLFPALFVGVIYNDGAEIAKHGFFDGYNGIVWTAIVLQSVSGLLASICINYADNIAKNFATSISIVISFVCSVFFFNFEMTSSGSQPLGPPRRYFSTGAALPPEGRRLTIERVVMMGPWLSNNPSWKPPSRLRNDRGGPPPRSQRPAGSSSRLFASSESEPTDGFDPFEPLSKPKHFHTGNDSSEYNGRYGSDLHQSIEYDPSNDDRQPAPTGNTHPSNLHRSRSHHPAHPALQFAARDGRYFEDLTPSAYQAAVPNLTQNPARRVNYNPGYQHSRPQALGQQVTPPSLPRTGTASYDQTYAGDQYQRNPPLPGSSSPTIKIGGRPKLTPKRPNALSSLIRRDNLPDRSELRTTYDAPQDTYGDYGDTDGALLPSYVNDQVRYHASQPSHPNDQTHHDFRRPSYMESEDSPPAPSTTPQADGSTTPVVHGVRLISLRQALPDRFRALFPYDLFNAVQSKCFPVVYAGTDNVVVSAPTGSGKTAILELAICKLALDRGNENFKIVYQAPTKALCSEKARGWEKKFAHMNLKCAELTGDTSQAEMRRVGDASIIVTTPEKWDSITRKWQDHKRLLQLVELFLIDEVHILKDARGATLEAVVSRMKTIGANVRFVALSATVPNSDDIAQWLGRNHTNQHLPAHRETFGEEFRPVKLQKFVYGYDYSGNEYMFEKFLDQKIPALISRHSQKKPILIFCFTRKSCETTAALLADYASSRPAGDKLWPMPSKRIPVIGRELQEIVKFGVAFHHAGIEHQDRMAVEQSFLKGDLGVICCTSTLAVGINLPCHTVFLKGTVGFCDDKVQEYSDLEVMQMLGRAGRPQFDDSATAVILTRKENKNRYEKMVSGQEILESTLHLNLIEHLNSEICLGTIHDLQSAKTWLSGTFLSVRLRRNPNYYRLTDSTSNPDQIDDKLAEICERDIKELQSVNLVTDRDAFKCTDYGIAMSKYLVEFTTMKMLLQISRAAKMESLITIISQATEFKEFRLKPMERHLFREINQSQLILYPVKEAVGQTWHKISLIVQAHLGCIQYPDSSEVGKIKRQLASERKVIFEKFNRLIQAVIDCKEHDGDSVGLKNALELARSLSAESWDGRATQLTQIPNIGPVGMRKLQAKGVRTVMELARREPEDIERFLSRQPPFGTIMLAGLENFPRLDLDLAVVGHKVQRSGEPAVNLEMKAILRYVNRRGPPQWKGRSPSLTFLAESSDEVVGFFWRGNIRKLDSQDGLELKFTVPLHDPSHSVACHFSCEELVGTNVSKVVHHNIPAAAFPKAPKPTPARATAKPTAARRFVDDDDGIDDRDLLGLTESTEIVHPTTTFTTEPLIEPEFGDFPSIEDLLEIEAAELEMATHQTSSHEPVQLPNGKWQCNHICAGDTLTKTGKACNHRCCKEGIDKPRKRTTRTKRKAENGREISQDLGDYQEEGSQHPQSTFYKSQHPPHHAPKPAKRSKPNHTQPPANIEQRPSPVPHKITQAIVEPKPFSLNDIDIECVDLSFSDDEANLKHLANSAPDNSARDDDFMLLDDHSHASVLSGHFKAGAKDAMLYKGISSKFDEAQEATSHSEQIDEMYGLNGVDDDETMACVSSSPMFLERAPGLRGLTSTQESTVGSMAAVDNKEDPQWLSEMQLDAEAMEIVNSLRGYVTFV